MCRIELSINLKTDYKNIYYILFYSSLCIIRLVGVLKY